MKVKTLIKYLIYFSPTPIKSLLHKKIEKKRVQLGMARYKRCKVSKEEVEDVLSKIDFNHDIMLHTSVFNIGHIAGGPKWLTNAILEHCDLENHTLIVSALPYFGSFADYLHDGMTFDVNTAPIAMGVVNERIAAMEGACRSAHPTHSVVAIGKDKKEYTAKHHLDDTPFGINSPYCKLLERKARILLFGATLHNLTFIHAVEDLLAENYPVKNIYSKHKYNIHCITDSGEKADVITPAHNPFKSISRNDGSMFETDGLSKGYIKKWPLGEGYVYEIDALAMANRYCEMLKEGRSMYGRCSKMNPDIFLSFNE